MRLIDADKLILDMAYWHGDKCTVDCIEPDGVSAVDVSDINSAPTIDPVKHGHWALDEDDDGAHCSQCGLDFSFCFFYQEQMHYCPNCGARMDDPNETK